MSQTEPLMPYRALVTVVDDDDSVREAMPYLLRELGYAAAAFSSAAEFLASDALLHTDCLMLDIAMPGMSGPELHAELLRRGLAIPVIFITARVEDKDRGALEKSGVVACLIKPFGEEALETALKAALTGT